MLGAITAFTLFDLITSFISVICSSVKPVVPTTRFTLFCEAVFIVFTAAPAMVKSTSTSGFIFFNTSFSLLAAVISIPIFPIPITSPMSFPAIGVSGDSIAAAIFMSS